MPEQTKTDDARTAPTTVSGDAAVEDEIDLTNPETALKWKAPEPAKPAAKPARPQKAERSVGSIVGPLFGVLALLLVVLLIALVAVLFNRVSDLEDQVGTGDGSGRTASLVRPVQEQVDDVQAQVDELQATADQLDAAQPGDATDADVAGLTARLDATIACLNTYMDTVATALNNGTSYVYVPC